MNDRQFNMLYANCYSTTVHFVLKGVGLGILMLQLFNKPTEGSGGLVDPPLAVTWPYIVFKVIATLVLFVQHCLVRTGKLYGWTNTFLKSP